MVKYDPAAVAAFLSEDTPAFNIARRINQTSEPGLDNCPAAHKAGFAAGIHRILSQIRNPRFRAEPMDQPRFRVKSRVMLGTDLILI